MKTLLSSAVALCVVGLFGSVASAAIIAPGGSALLGGGPVAAPSPANLITSITSPFGIIGTDDLTGTVKTDVYSESGLLTFVYTVTDNVNPSSIDNVGRAVFNSFTGFTTDIGYIVGTGDIPNSVDRSGSGKTIGFDFKDALNNDSLLPGQSSVSLVVRTNATGYTTSTSSVIDSISYNVSVLSPSAGSGRTPEPASLGVLALAGVAVLRRRK